MRTTKNNKSRRRKRLIADMLICTAVTSLAMAAGIGIGIQYAENNNANDEESPSESAAFARVREAFNELAERHVIRPDEDELARAAIQGMTDALDPHTDLLTGDDAAPFNPGYNENNAGIGISIRREIKSGNIYIAAVTEDKPAASAGLQAGDIITQIDDVIVEDHTPRDVINLIRGPIDEPVALTIQRNDETISFEIERAIITRDYVTHTLIDNDVGYVHISRFKGNTADDVRNALEELSSQIDSENARYILDLRGNLGGYTSHAIEITDLFIDQRVPVMLAPRTQQKEWATPGDILQGAPLIILIDESSASASEMLASALQEHGRAEILGRQSYGKGTMQEWVIQDNGDVVKITTDYFHLPSGASIQGTGVIPDTFYITQPYEENNRRRYADLQNGLPNVSTEEYDIVPLYHCQLRADIDSIELSASFRYADGKPDGFKACAVDILRDQEDYTIRGPILPGNTPEI